MKFSLALRLSQHLEATLQVRSGLQCAVPLKMPNYIRVKLAVKLAVMAAGLVGVTKVF